VRFILKAMVAIVLLAMAWAILDLGNTYATNAGAWHAEQAAIARISQLGGQVTAVHRHMHRGTPLDSLHLRWFDYLADRARAVSLAGTHATDDDLKIVSSLEGLVDLDVSRTAVSDACIPYVLKLHYLRSLDLRSTLVTKKGLERLDAECSRALIWRD
jgi:hypothetical protein